MAFRLIAAKCSSLDELGRAMAWILFNFDRMEQEREVSATVRQMVIGKLKTTNAMHRSGPQRIRSLFPLPLGCVSKVLEAAQLSALDDFCRPQFAGLTAADVWTSLGVLGVNGTAGCGRASSTRVGTISQKMAVDSIRQSTNSVLSHDARLDRTPEQAEKELSSRFLSYTGEEIPKMQILGLEAAKAALPPASHGGSIDALSLVSEGTRWFLEHPEESLLPSAPEGVKLQAKVHITPGEALEFCSLLVERRICTWVRDDTVLTVNNQQILNGMFAVGKNTFLDSGAEVQRTIMNLVPTNSVFRQAQGATGDLPSICQYLSLVLHNNEALAFYQSDMSSAFYLFRVPSVWSRMMAFNISFPGEAIGLQAGVVYRPACAVIPMGWHSAVSVMQEIADRLTVLARLPASHQVKRSALLPAWLTETLCQADSSQRPWFHVYLDNFCAMQKTSTSSAPHAGAAMHDALEAAWSEAGVLSSVKKRVSGAPTAQELGAEILGAQGTIGPSTDRILKLVQSTLVVIGKPKLRKKWVQVIAGRWVHCMAFRRPTMVTIDQTWAYVSHQASGSTVEAKVRGELFGCCVLALLMHTNLRAGISETTTASDASSTGGAVGKSTTLTAAGCQFASLDRSNLAGGTTAPILVLSLFNGIGCTFRCYDLVGIRPLVALSYELNASANRITSRRWPNVQICKDVRSIDLDAIRQWRYKYPMVEQIHVWGGFPCVDLSAVKFGRRNLDGDESSLFYELPRIIKQIRQVYGFSFPVFYAIENVASMDQSAEQEISQVLGCRPLRFDPCDVVPIHRPRLCWSNTDLAPMDGVELEEKQRWVEVHFSHPYPDLSQWLEPGAEWPGYEEGAVLPTCQASQADRRRARQHIILEDVGITSATLERYYTAVSRLAPVLTQVNSELELDDMIADWIQAEFEDGCPLYMVADALSGLHHFEPFTKKKLTKSWRLYSIWRRYEVPCRAPPLTKDITLAMSGYCIEQCELVMGALLLLGFHCLMRTGELLQVRPCDFILDNSVGLVSIPSSKSGVRHNVRESVTIRDPITLELVHAMLELRRAQGFEKTPCWDRSGSAFRDLFRRILVALNVDRLGFRPYSLRRGGATFEMQSHGLMERTLIRGRYWIIGLTTAIILVLLSVSSSCRAAVQDAGVQPEDGSLQWTVKTSVYVSIWSLLAGTLAALCGIGGGMIMGPKLLELGCLPQVQSATTATTLFVMSSSTAIAFWVQGTAAIDYSLWLGFATALGAVVGKALVGWLVKRLQRPSVIMFLLGGIIALSVVVMSITGFIDVVDDIVQGNDMGFRDPCAEAS
eukprot:s1586_g28.t1